jgi:hypothetical protein
MTVAVNSRRMPNYVGDGSADEFDFSFKIYAKTELRVTKLDVDAGTETLLVVDTDYTVAGVGSRNGGSITLVAGNLPVDFELIIEGKRPISQAADLKNLADFYPETYEEALDKIVMMLQELFTSAERSIRLARSTPLEDFDPSLPVLPEANRMLMINAAGTGFALGPTPQELSEAASNLAATIAARDEAIAAQAAAEAAQTAAEAAVTTAQAAATAADASADSAALSELAAATAVGEAEDARDDAQAAAALLTAITTGGTTGQVLTKDSNVDGEYSWQDPTGGGGGPSGTPDQGSLVGTYAAGDTTYTLPNAPLEPMALLGWLGGVFQVQDVHYTLSGTTITVPGEDTSAENFNYFMRH